MLVWRAVVPRLLLRWDVALFALGALIFTWRLGVGTSWTVDDAYIVARYAEHLTSGSGLRWNVDERPIEGFTSYVGLAAVVLGTLAGKPFVFAKALSIGCVYFGGAGLLLLGRRWRVHASLSGTSALLWFLPAAQVTHALSGLETTVFAAGTIALAWTLDHASVRRTYTPLWAACVFLTLTRPEGIAFSLTALVALLWLLRGDTHARIACIRSFAFRFGIPFMAGALVRRIYFSSFLPNTYYAKQGGHSARAFFEECAQLVAHEWGAEWFALGIAFWVLSRRDKLPRSPSGPRWIAFAVLFAAGACVLSYARSSLAMNYSHRFAFHLFGVWCVVGLALLAGVSASPRRVAHGIFALAVSPALYGGITQHPKEDNFRQASSRGSEGLYLPMARILQETVDKTATVACYPDAGIIPYTTRLRTIDFGRLNDWYLARFGASPVATRDYFFLRAPDALIVQRKNRSEWFDDGASLILTDPRMKQYEQIAAVTDRSPNGQIGLVLFVRKK